MNNMKRCVILWLGLTTFTVIIFVPILFGGWIRTAALLLYLLTMLAACPAQLFLTLQSRKYVPKLLQLNIYFWISVIVALAESAYSLFGMLLLAYKLLSGSGFTNILMNVHRVGLFSGLGLLFSSFVWWDTRCITQQQKGKGSVQKGVKP
jgi:hypothetical protein